MRAELERKMAVVNFTRLKLVSEAPRAMLVEYQGKCVWVQMAAVTQFVRNEDGTVNITIQEFAAMKAGFYS